MRSSTFSVLLSLFVFFAAGLRAELALAAKVDGSRLKIAEVRTSSWIGTDREKRVIIDDDTPLVVEGDLAAETRSVLWSPTYYLLHPPLRDRLTDAQRPWVGYVRLVNGAGWFGPTFDDLWPAPIPDTAVVVFGWVVGGKIVQTRAQRLPANPHRKTFRLDHIFQLSDAEAAGQGVVLVWTQGHFVAPRPWFKDPNAQAALENMLVGNLAGMVTALQRGVKPHVTGHNDWTLLDFAAEAGLVEAIPPLVTHGLDLNFGFRSGPLLAAASKGRTAAVDRILAFDLPVKNVPLAWILRWGHDEPARHILAKDMKGFQREHRALEAALTGGFADIAESLLARGASYPFSSGKSAALLMEQTKLGHTRVVQLLLKRKSDPDAGTNGRAPLLVAAIARDQPLLDTFLRAGAKVDVTDPLGTTPLMLACSALDLAAVQALLAAGADVNAKSKGGNTALHFAAIENHVPLIELLLRHGSNLNAVGARDKRPLEVALLANAGDAARLLAGRGAECNLPFEQRDVLIEAAIRMDVVEVVRTALATGWPADTRFDQRWPAAWIAQSHGATRVLAALQSANPAALIAFSAPPIVPSRELDAPLQLREHPVVADPRDSSHRQKPQVVEIKVTIDDEGRVSSPRLISGGSGRLNFMALQAVRTHRFSPPMKAGNPTCTELTVPILFAADPKAAIETAFVDAPPLRITQMRPSLPAVSQSAGGEIIRLNSRNLEGQVRLQIVVESDGHAYRANVLDAPDGANAHAASEALPEWAFTPGIRDGLPVTTLTELIMN